MTADRLIENKALAYIRRWDMTTPGGELLIALSGGADSVALLGILNALSQRLGIALRAIHINHCLRAQEADRDELYCRELCEKLGVPFISVKRDVAGLAEDLRISTELAGRIARQQEFVKHSLGAPVATAHTLSDNAETVLHNLSRGTALSGLCGIPPVTVINKTTFVRPLLELTRAQTEEYCRAKRMEYMCDSTNESFEYTRNRIRHGIIPAIKTHINPSFERAVMNAAETLRTDSDFLESSAAKALSGVLLSKSEGAAVLSVGGLLALHDALSSRIIKSVLEELMNKPPSKAHITAAAGLCKNPSPSARAVLPDRVVVRREYDSLAFCLEAEPPANEYEFCLKEGILNIEGLGGLKVSIKKPDKNPVNFNTLFTQLYIPCDKLNANFVARSRREGDLIRLPGGTKSIKRLMIDKKIPRALRAVLPVICDESGKVAAVLGCGVSAEYAAAKNGEYSLIIELKGSKI